MRKKIFSSVFALALLTTAGWGVNKSMNINANLSDLALANVEALADGESGNDKGTLYGNEEGTKFCCCPGTNDCSATDCPSGICEN